MQIRQQYEIVSMKYEEINHIKLNSYCNLLLLDPSQSILIVVLCVGLQKFYFFKSGEFKHIGNFNEIVNLKWLYSFQCQKLYLALNSINKYSIRSLNSINNNKILTSLSFGEYITFITYTKFEDLMLIGFRMGRLQFKKKDFLQWYTIQEMELAFQIVNIHLNQQENKIIVEVNPIKIIIIEKKNQSVEQIWVVVQEIKIYESFRNIIFINDNTFAVKLFNIRKWMLFKQKNQCQFIHKRDIIIFGANEDLYYILNKYHKGRIKNPDESSCFLNEEFQLDHTYLVLKDKEQFNNQSFFLGLQDDNKINGQYLFSKVFKDKQIIIGKYKQLLIEYTLVKSIMFPQNQHYYAMALKSDNKILVLGLKNQIQVFKLENFLFQKLQVLNNHSRSVDCLLFFKNQNSFIELLAPILKVYNFS